MRSWRDLRGHLIRFRYAQLPVSPAGSVGTSALRQRCSLNTRAPKGRGYKRVETRTLEGKA